MSDNEMTEIEAIRALVEYTWKQENIDRINDEIKRYIDKIVGEVKVKVEKRALADVKKSLAERVDGELKIELEMRLTDQIRADLEKIANDMREGLEKRVAGEIKESIEKGIVDSRKPARLPLVLALSAASICLGVAIAALAGLLG